MALAIEKPLVPGPQFPDPSDVVPIEDKLDIVVVFTSAAETIRALQQAAALARRLDSRITLLVPQLVQYPLPLTSPPVLLDFNERRFLAFARESRVETTVRIYLCRDRCDALMLVLPPHSVVVVGSRDRWWPTAEKRLARKLRRAGHEVIVVETE